MAEDFGRTTREVEGYDGTRGEVKWWFEAWGSGPKGTWHQRDKVGHPPTPGDLRNADFITIGMEFPGDPHPQYRTKRGGLDV